MARELTLLGFYTSQVGITENMEYSPAPAAVPRLRADIADGETRPLGMTSRGAEGVSPIFSKLKIGPDPKERP